MDYPTFKQVLKHVKKALIEDKYLSQYICVNIEYVVKDVYNLNWTNTIVTRYQEKVQEQLDGVKLKSYENWMEHFYPSIYARMTPDNFREGRIQWIDNMLTRKDL